jgi:serine protease Do
MAIFPRLRNILATAVVTCALASPALASDRAPRPSPEELLRAVVRLTAVVPPEARTADTLGTERAGNGVVIDDNGLVLTIGYLVLEAMSVLVTDGAGKPVLAEIIGYDHETGLGLVRALTPLGIRPLRFGDSAALAEGEDALAISHGGARHMTPVRVVSRREFTGYWEYLLDSGIYTAPPHLDWSGAALVGQDGRLLGIGSLLVNNALPGASTGPGNLFVPVDLLRPILGDLLASGRRADETRPWLGVTSVEALGRVAIARVAPDGPAFRAGLQAGDVVVKVGAAEVATLSEFLRGVWGQGRPGSVIPVTVMRDGQVYVFRVTSGSRYDYLRLKQSY